MTNIKGLVNNYVTLSCLYAKFHWFIFHVQLSFQPLPVKVSTISWCYVITERSKTQTNNNKKTGNETVKKTGNETVKKTGNETVKKTGNQTFKKNGNQT